MALDPKLASLLEAVVEGDQEAQGALIATYYPQVQAIVHRKLEADFRKNHRWILPLFSTRDVVQDVFRSVVQGLDETSFESEQAFVGYLGAVVRNRLLDAVRFHEAARRDVRRKAETPEQGLDVLREATRSDAAPPFAAELAEQSHLVRAAMDELPERQRLLLELRTIEGKSFPEIADELGYSSAESCRQSHVAAQAKLLVKLRAKGVRPD